MYLWIYKYIVNEVAKRLFGIFHFVKNRSRSSLASSRGLKNCNEFFDSLEDITVVMPNITRLSFWVKKQKTKLSLRHTLRNFFLRKKPFQVFTFLVLTSAKTNGFCECSESITVVTFNYYSTRTYFLEGGTIFLI